MKTHLLKKLDNNIGFWKHDGYICARSIYP